MREYIIWESDGIEVQGHYVTQHEQREEIVRCRDCKHYDVDGHGQGWCIWKYRTDWQVEPDGFCAWGERREHA